MSIRRVGFEQKAVPRPLLLAPVAALVGLFAVACAPRSQVPPSTAASTARPARARGPAESEPTVSYVAGPIGLDPAGRVWARVPSHVIALRPQELIEPHGGGSVRELRVQAIHNGNAIAWRFEWADASRNDRISVGDFRDAVAVQFPAGHAEVSSPLMGDHEHFVNIWQWKAELQSYANEGRNLSPVEDLVAAGFGTITRQPNQDVLGFGVHVDGRWRVVMLRRLDAPDAADARFTPGTRKLVGFAVWEGGAAERDGKKSLTPQWLEFAIAPLGGGAVEQPRALTFLQRGRYLFERTGCTTCHGPGGSEGLSMQNYARGTVPPLHTLADRMFVRDRESARQIIRLLEQGRDLASIAAPDGVADFQRVLAQYRAVREVIVRGSTAGRQDAMGPQPPVSMPSWRGVLGERDIDALIAYVLSSFPWEEEE